VAIAFAREGANLVIAYRGQQAAAARRHVLIAGEVRDDQFRRELIERTVAELGSVDILVNNSVFQWANQPLDPRSVMELEETFRTSAESILLLAQAAAERMAPGASIINTTAARLRPPSEQQRAYAAHGHAVDNVTLTLAESLAAKGIRVNAIAPGPVWTEEVLRALPPSAAPTLGQNTPLGRPAQPVELAPAYVFLASNEAMCITGAVIPVSATS
jgi:NAD(P)-dependent dehydrogenase (short-subunit alcohol dehydrogenase family)